MANYDVLRQNKIYLLHKGFAILEANTRAFEAGEFEFSSFIAIVYALRDLTKCELILFHLSWDNTLIRALVTLDIFPSSCQSSLIDIKPQTLLV